MDDTPTKGKVHGFVCDYSNVVPVRSEFQGCSTQDMEFGIVITALTCTAGNLDLTRQPLEWFHCSSFQFFLHSTGSLLTSYPTVYMRLYDVSHFWYLRMVRITGECFTILVTLHVELPCKLADHMHNTFLIRHHALCLHFDHSLFVCALLPVKLNYKKLCFNPCFMHFWPSFLWFALK